MAMLCVRQCLIARSYQHLRRQAASSAGTTSRRLSAHLREHGWALNHTKRAIINAEAREAVLTHTGFSKRLYLHGRARNQGLF